MADQRVILRRVPPVRGMTPFAATAAGTKRQTGSALGLPMAKTGADPVSSPSPIPPEARTPPAVFAFGPAGTYADEIRTVDEAFRFAASVKDLDGAMRTLRRIHHPDCARAFLREAASFLSRSKEVNVLPPDWTMPDQLANCEEMGKREVVPFVRRSGLWHIYLAHLRYGSAVSAPADEGVDGLGRAEMGDTEPIPGFARCDLLSWARERSPEITNGTRGARSLGSSIPSPPEAKPLSPGREAATLSRPPRITPHESEPHEAVLPTKRRSWRKGKRRASPRAEGGRDTGGDGTPREGDGGCGGGGSRRGTPSSGSGERAATETGPEEETTKMRTKTDPADAATDGTRVAHALRRSVLDQSPGGEGPKAIALRGSPPETVHVVDLSNGNRASGLMEEVFLWSPKYR